ncbi:hybrid sensor histidine kinase/response regulator transcription factor [Bacteroides ovatus]|uniref:hybrid sensor histidine kinase/response regulator transcription factor n=1 Tax=Bacteroides ovatus TaxID=28116 RepID=UPI0018983E75|nr:response regulator [Bacteroides ovatus]
MRKVCLLLLLLSRFIVAYSIDTHWDLIPAVIKNEVGNNTIYDICYGSDGFMWLSTDKGITRYDGFRFRDYPLIMSTDSLFMSLHQTVKSLREGPDGLYYALLFQGGVICFDSASEKFLPLSFDKSFKLEEVSDFCWNGGKLYLATLQGLYETSVSRKTEKEGDFIYCVLSPQPLVKGKIVDLYTDGKDHLYFSVDEKKVMSYDIATKKSSLIKEYNVVNRLFLQHGYLWICGLWNDIVCHDLKTHKEQVISINKVFRTEYFKAYITDLVFKNHKTFYLTTWDGLFKLSFENENLCESPFTLTHLSGNVEAFRPDIENRMTSLLWDEQQQILWAGTFGGGIVKFDISNSIYSRVQQRFESRISGMIEDARGYIWVAMSDGCIMKSIEPGLSVHTRFEPWEKASVYSGRCTIFKCKGGQIWLGGRHGEVILIHPVTEKVEYFHLQTSDGKDIHAAIQCFCQDSRNRLWIGTSEGLMRFDPKTRAYKKINLPVGIENIFAMKEDKEGNIWIGTNKGLKRIHTEDDLVRVEGNYEKENGFAETAVRTIYVNNYNQIYAAYLNLVVCIDGRKKDKIESVYTLQNGLPNGHVSCMVDDYMGSIWAGNNVGIITIRNGQEAFYNYLLIGNCNSVCRLNDGRLLWANSRGLIFFDPAAVKATKRKKRVMLTDIKVNGEIILAGEKRNGQVILSGAPEKQEKLLFSSRNNSFHLYFSDLRYGMAQRKIAYRLLPVDTNWKMLPLEEGLWYKGLAAGKYTLQAKLAFPDGKEGEVYQIDVVVKSKWYCTVWAYIGYVLLTVLLCWFLYAYNKKKEQHKQLRRDKEMMLRENLNLERMKQEQKREKEVMRKRLLMLFVQDLRTPLSLIFAPLKDLHSKFKGQNPSLQVAYRNALRMLDACDQLSAIYGPEGLAVKLEVASYPVEKIIDSNLFKIRELLKIYPIDFHYEIRIRKELEFYVDEKKVEFIIHNLLTNAFTHTNYTGVVSFSIYETVRDNLTYVSLMVVDDGKNKVRTLEQQLNEDELSDNELSTTQLGFSTVQQMVNAHHGMISFESSEGKGTKVTMHLPIDKSVFENDPNVLFVDPKELMEPDTVLVGETELELQADSELTPDISESGMPPQPVDTEIERLQSADISKKTILIVEDHNDIRVYLKVLLGKEYNLLMATNGQEGVDMAMKELPDLILCDVMMPVKDGFECCREVKEGLETCGIPLIMLTAKVEDEDIIHGLELGADDYLLKPFTPSILMAKVRNLINGRQALKRIYSQLFMLPEKDAVETGDATEQVIEEVKKEDPFISSVIKIVEENICEADFSVKKLASELNMSQPTLYRKVKQSTDYTIIELIRGVRMRRAGVLLKTKQYAVQEVAEMVGYNDIPTFRKHFVDAFGTTPSTYE